MGEAITMSDDYATIDWELPRDVLEAILILLPGNSIARCTCVTKAWRDMIEERLALREKVAEAKSAFVPLKWILNPRWRPLIVYVPRYLVEQRAEKERAEKERAEEERARAKRAREERALREENASRVGEALKRRHEKGRKGDREHALKREWRNRMQAPRIQHPIFTPRVRGSENNKNRSSKKRA